MQFGLENEYEKQKHISIQSRIALTTNYTNEKLLVVILNRQGARAEGIFI